MEDSPRASTEAFCLTAEAAVAQALGLVGGGGAGPVAAEAADPERTRLARLGLQLGLLAEELAELLYMYDHATAEERRLSRFVALLARYQRYVTWRAAGGGGGDLLPA